MADSVSLWSEKNSNLLAVLFFFLLFSLVVLIGTYKMGDDLGFDFAGYAQRYHFAFSGWVKNLLGGVPADIFVPTLPSIFPLFFRTLGLGSFTLPLALSALLFRISLVFSFVLIARHFKVHWALGGIAGLLLVLNPITYSFFDRYYELAAWAFFALSFLFLYRLVQEKSFSLNNFLASSIFGALCTLSSSVGVFFLGMASVFLITSKDDLKKIIAVWILLIGLSAYWLFPFVAYYDLSIISRFEGHVLQTPGTFYSSVFLVLALGASILYFYKKIPQERRAFQLLSLTFLISVIRIIFPTLPVIGKAFTHSYHIFYLFVLFFCFLAIAKKIPADKKFFTSIGSVFLTLVVLGGPMMFERYTFKSVSFSNYELNGEAINFLEVENALKQIPKNTRFETLPYDPVISAPASVLYDLTSVFGWGFNGVTLVGFEDLKMDFSKKQVLCSEILRAEKLFGLSHVISLTSESSKDLEECGFEKIKTLNQVSLFVSPRFEGKSFLVENGELLEYSNTKVVLLANPPSVLFKENYFPRWKAYVNGNPAEIIDKKPGMQVSVEKKSLVELRYEWTIIEFTGFFVTAIATIIMIVLIILLAKRKK